LICEINPRSDDCLVPPSSSSSASARINTGETPTFSVFGTANGLISFLPGTNGSMSTRRAEVEAAAPLVESPQFVTSAGYSSRGGSIEERRINSMERARTHYGE